MWGWGPAQRKQIFKKKIYEYRLLFYKLFIQ
jgi:hypothetical protein